MIAVISLSGCKAKRQSVRQGNDTVGSRSSSNTKIKSDSSLTSHAVERVKLKVRNLGGKSLWLINDKNTLNRKIINLSDEEGISSSTRSPNGKYLAFVRYNTAGHSPLTTSHVWITNANGEYLKEIILPSPDERFSTFDPEWRTDELLIVSAITLVVPEGQKFLYNINTKKIEKLGSK